VVLLDIRFTQADLQRIVSQSNLRKQQTVRVSNTTLWKEIPSSSIVCGNPSTGVTCAIATLLDPTRIILDDTMNHLVKLPPYFLRGCAAMAHVDLGPLANVQEVGDGFLYGCSSLVDVQLGALAGVKKLGASFLGLCSSLVQLSLPPLSNVTEIPAHAFTGCSSLQRLDLRGLSNVTKVGSHFLLQCTSLSEVDLAPLSNVREVGQNFLNGCPSRAKVDLRPLSGVEKDKLGDSFLHGCFVPLEVIVASEDQIKAVDPKLPSGVLFVIRRVEAPQN
jgi:hypothetical protein